MSLVFLDNYAAECWCILYYYILLYSHPQATAFLCTAIFFIGSNFVGTEKVN